jgi:hypothetical protein
MGHAFPSGAPLIVKLVWNREAYRFGRMSGRLAETYGWRHAKQKAPFGALRQKTEKKWWPAGDSVEEATICPQAGRAPELPGDAADLSIRRALRPL